MTDGVFRCQRYFRCSPGAGLFVSLDKLTVAVDEPDVSVTGNKNTFYCSLTWNADLSVTGKRGG